MSPQKSTKVPVDVEMDDQGRIVLNSAELTEKLRDGVSPDARAARGLIININCVAGCGGGLGGSAGGPQM
ncbi:hypothetical protein [Streptomyces sp. ISID311]|uniref:hypothetical protein n=1 Tax=Streptomyces sp. ISID311 TaxID=2601673 RepID=UPI0011BD2F9C|nr:hypothetical protein [Streptomyces sp. ISID311]TXC97177.1 hypothetical protein FS847_15415 [Streptomyces sp. ISID311]